MPKPRNKQIALAETPFYNLTYRCVRRSFLCGEIDGFNFTYRIPDIHFPDLTLTFLQPQLKLMEILSG